MAPLTGIKVVEFAGLAPGPFAGMVLADWGADVIRIDKTDQSSTSDILSRGKRSIAVDPKVSGGLEIIKRLVNKADVVIDPFRPGVLERLGLGPDVFLDPQSGTNRRLVFARLRGFSSDGPQKDMAGHDLNYLAQSGVLSLLPPINPLGKPSFPVNILADFAGGGLMCAMGILLALIERQKSGLGQVVDNNMVEGARYVSSFPLIFSNQKPGPFFGGPPGENVLDGGAPFYDLYQCKDGKWMSVACLEPQFFATFLRLLQSSLPSTWVSPDSPYKPTSVSQGNRNDWPKMRSYFESAFKLKTRQEWADIFHGSDACVTPVLNLKEANHANKSIVPRPHPLLSRTPFLEPLRDQNATLLSPGQHTLHILQELQFTADELQNIADSGALGRKLPPIRSKL